MKILGIHDGHNCGATLLEDGKITASISEERLSRKKNDAGYPKRAVEAVLKIGDCTPKEIDLVALSTRFMNPGSFFFDWNWYKKPEDKRTKEEKEVYFLKQRIIERKKEICEHLGIPPEKIIIIEHHLAHAAAAYYGSHLAGTGEKVLVLTLDGAGDGVCSTVNIGEKGKIIRIADTESRASLGKIYSRITYLLGMKPWEHEYKVMGLAPYADENGVKKSYEVINSLIELAEDGLTFKTKTSLSTNDCYPYLREKLENHRFDWMAGAIQQLQEELVTQWIKNAIAKTGLKKIACGGGSFMNVKANMKAFELSEVEDFFVFPSCGDESLSIGAVYQVYAEWLEKNNKEGKIYPLGVNYFGPEFSGKEVEAAIDETGANKKYQTKKEKDINKTVVSLLTCGEIVARFSGRMEWGARALGNRSILVDPRKKEKTRELNVAIKQRDFWMPFASTVLFERQNDYLINSKNIKAPYMIMAFQTTEKGKEDLAAAIHPYDFTARPQILEVNFNPDYYDLIKKFEAATGVGAILNTSFNLHGEPIVCSPKDALSTFEKSGLKHLAIGNYLISKK